MRKIRYKGRIYVEVDAEEFDPKKNLKETLKLGEETLKKINAQIALAKQNGASEEVLHELAVAKQHVEAMNKSTRDALRGKYPSMKEIYESARKVVGAGRIR